MNKDENKTPPKENQKENKSVEKNEKTLLNAKNEEKNVFEVSEEKENKNENKSPEEKEEKKEIEAPEEKTDLDNFMDEWGDDDEDEDFDFEDLDLDDIEEEDEDPDEEFKGEPASDNEPPPSETVGETKERVSSEKNRENLERIGAKFLGKADLFKATLCSKIGRKHLAEYVADDDTIDILIQCIKEYLDTKEVEEPSPFAALMLALAMWTLPPLGVALLDRFSLPKEDKTAPKKKTSKSLNQETDTPTQEEPKADYSKLREYQEKRKTFSLNADGKYNRVPDGKTYIKVEFADEYPSPEVQEWIEEGKKDREIRKLLDYGEQ
jgi:hypothetical protein